MSRFRVSLQPGIVRDPENDVVTVRFFSPRTAEEVTVILLEMDSWRYRRDTMAEQLDNQDDPIAVFTGTIERSRFQVQTHRLERGTRNNAPTIKLKFHGSDTEYQLPVPDSSLREEGEEMEIGLEVRGRIRRRRRLVEVEYKTPVPVFVRNYGRAGAPQRPVITFLTGRNGFFRAAQRFLQRRPDGLIRRSSVEAILNYLSSQQNLAEYGEGRWGEVNIVSHANVNQWMIRLFSDPHEPYRYVDVNVLNQQGNDARLTAPGEEVLDNRSRIVIRGCVIGGNQTLLDRIRQLFGGHAYVYAPKYLQAYEWYRRGRLRLQREYFKEFFFFYVPGRRSPNERECIRRFQELYPHAGIDEAEWRNLLRHRGERERRDRTERFRFTLEYQEIPPRGREALMADLRAEFPSGEETYHTTVDDWQWQIRRQVSRRRRIYRVLYIGYRRRVEVRRPLRDNNGDMVVPNLYDSSHYGRSPAW